jgi:hypothetical protein
MRTLGGGGGLWERGGCSVVTSLKQRSVHGNKCGEGVGKDLKVKFQSLKSDVGVKSTKQHDVITENSPTIALSCATLLQP